MKKRISDVHKVQGYFIQAPSATSVPEGHEPYVTLSDLAGLTAARPASSPSALAVHSKYMLSLRECLAVTDDELENVAGKILEERGRDMTYSITAFRSLRRRFPKALDRCIHAAIIRAMSKQQ